MTYCLCVRALPSHVFCSARKSTPAQALHAPISPIRRRLPAAPLLLALPGCHVSWTEHHSHLPRPSDFRLREPTPSNYKLQHPGIMAAKPPPYRNFLSPFLHRQFGYVMGLTLILCYGFSIWMGSFNSCMPRVLQPHILSATDMFRSDLDVVPRWGPRTASFHCFPLHSLPVYGTCPL